MSTNAPAEEAPPHPKALIYPPASLHTRRSGQGAMREGERERQRGRGMVASGYAAGGGTRLVLAAVVAALMAGSAEGTLRGDPVQMFKRMRFGDQRSVWSDVLVGQGPLFEVDRAVELHLPTEDWVMSSTAVKLQFSYDHEKHTSEWLTLSDGKGLALDTITVIFVYSGSDIKEVFHREHTTATSRC